MKSSARKFRALTDMEIRNFKPADKVYLMGHGGGLYIQVFPNGNKLWGMKYRVDGKERRTSFGAWPGVSILEAQSKRDEIKSLLKQGIDPAQHKKAVKTAAKEEARQQAATFKLVAQEWFSMAGPDLAPKYAAKISSYLDKVINPLLGDKLVADIKPADVLEVSQHEQKKGHICTAHKVANIMGQVLQYAFIKGLVPINVGRGITSALQSRRPVNFPAITEPKAIGKLLRDIFDYPGHYSIVYYLKILPFIFTRPGELRLAKWEEMDFENAMLTIPWPRLKTRKTSQKDHKVPLATQVLALFKELYRFTGAGDFVFPSIRSKVDTISDAGPLNALRDMGYPKEVMTLHGFRSTASTRLNEMGFRPDIIEAQLAHKDRDSIRAVYNRSEYLEERREMMQKWADYLVDLRDNLEREAETRFVTDGRSKAK